MIPNKFKMLALSAVAASGLSCASENNNGAVEQHSSVGDPVDPVPAATGTDAAGDGSEVDEGITGAPGSQDVVAVVAPAQQPMDEAIIVETAQDAAQTEAEENMECASSSEGTELQDVVLAFAFDVSGSMGVSDENLTLKWAPIVEATKAFFADSESDGLLATLTFFPSEAAGTVDGTGGGAFGGGGGGDDGDSCSALEYQAPDVALTRLPSADFGTAIDGVVPNRYGTPTMAVLQGTIDSVRAMQADDGLSANFVIVLVTDGVPSYCSDDQDDIANVAAVAADVAGELPVYVIGVDSPTPPMGAQAGEGLQNLDVIAQQGGTESAFIIDTGDPAQTSADFKAVVDQIRETAFTCNVNIPAPPDGQEFDKERVNVNYSNMMGQTDFTYDPACAADFGWRYDNEDSPNLIEMCPTVCEAIKADVMNQGQLNVEFGCVRRVGRAN